MGGSARMPDSDYRIIRRSSHRRPCGSQLFESFPPEYLYRSKIDSFHKSLQCLVDSRIVASSKSVYILIKERQYVDTEKYDLVVLGSGTGSKVAAWTTAAQGKRVALIERKYVGGSCHNIACLPSKNIIHSAKVASYVRRSKEFGITIDGFRIDMSAVRDRKRRMVSHSVDLHVDIFRKSGVELIHGSGRFTGPRTLEVTQANGTRRLVRGDKVIISTGTRATLEAIPGLAEAQPLTHIEALELDVIPEHLIVIGGGYVGLELAQAMRRFGSKVSVIDRNDRLLHREDEDVSEGLRGLFDDERIDLVLNARLKSISGKSGQTVQVVIEQNG